MPIITIFPLQNGAAAGQLNWKRFEMAWKLSKWKEADTVTGCVQVSGVKVLKEQRGKEKKWSDVISSFGNDLRIMQMDSIDNNHFRQSVCGIWHFWGTRNSLNHCWMKVLSKHLVKRMFYQVPPSNRFNFVFFETRPSISSRSPIDW